METLNAVAKPSPLLRLCGRKLPIKPSYLLVLIIMILAAQSYFFWDTTVIATIRNCKDKQFFLSSEYLISIIKGIGKGEVAVLIALVAGMRGYGRLAVEILLALVISSLLVLPLKVAVHRERPRGNSFVSFPSGDAATAAAVAEPIVSAAPGLLPVTAVVVVGVAMGRVLDDAHYPSDVLFGICWIKQQILPIILLQPLSEYAQCHRGRFLLQWPAPSSQ